MVTSRSPLPLVSVKGTGDAKFLEVQRVRHRYGRTEDDALTLKHRKVNLLEVLLT